MFLKYASSGHFMISFRVTLRRTSDCAAMVVFSKRGASTESLGVAKRIVKALRWEQLHLI